MMANMYYNPNKAGYGPRDHLMPGARPEKVKEGPSKRDPLIAATRWIYGM